MVIGRRFETRRRRPWWSRVAEDIRSRDSLVKVNVLRKGDEVRTDVLRAATTFAGQRSHERRWCFEKDTRGQRNAQDEAPIR